MVSLDYLDERLARSKEQMQQRQTVLLPLCKRKKKWTRIEPEQAFYGIHEYLMSSGWTEVHIQTEKKKRLFQNKSGENPQIRWPKKEMDVDPRRGKNCRKSWKKQKSHFLGWNITDKNWEKKQGENQREKSWTLTASVSTRVSVMFVRDYFQSKQTQSTTVVYWAAAIKPLTFMHLEQIFKVKWGLKTYLDDDLSCSCGVFLLIMADIHKKIRLQMHSWVFIYSNR